MRKVLVGLILVGGIVLIGCAPAKKIIKPESTLVPSGKISEKIEEKTIGIKPEEQLVKIDSEKITTREATTGKYFEDENMFQNIYFDYDKYEIRPEAKSVLATACSWFLKNSLVKILIEGHCDERGTTEYNLVLGDRRAKSVRDYLAAFGIGSERIETVSYGEERPVSFERTEEGFQKNRRAQFVVLNLKELSK